MGGQNVTDVDAWTAPVVVPADTDPADATYVRTAAQGLANRTRYTLARMSGQILGKPTLYCTASGGTTFGWDALPQIALPDAVSGHVVCAALAAGTLSVGTLTASTWRYVYATYDAGVTIEVSTTAPEVGLVFKTGDATRRYLGCFVSDSSSKIVPFRSVGGRCVYRRSAIATFPGRFAKTTSVAWSDQVLGAVVPPHALLADLLLETSSVNAAYFDLEVRTKGDTANSTALHANVASGANPGFNSTSVALECDSSSTIQFQTNGGTGLAAGDGAVITVLGFQE